MRNINHNEVDQSFKEFTSSTKNLVWESLNHIKRNKAHNMWLTLIWLNGPKLDKLALTH
jgi:hypothetical protein